jgi:hypothetical protein
MMDLITRVQPSYTNGFQSQLAALNAKVSVKIDDITRKLSVVFLFENARWPKLWASYSVIESANGAPLLFFDGSAVVGQIDGLTMGDVVRYVGLELAEAKALADSEGRKSGRWALDAVAC